MSNRLGLSGQIAKRFLTTEITPLLALVGLLLGLLVGLLVIGGHVGMRPVIAAFVVAGLMMATRCISPPLS